MTGIALGLAGAVALGRLAASLIKDVSPRDGLTLSSVALLLLVTAVVAAWIAARRVSRIDPVSALKSE